MRYAAGRDVGCDHCWAVRLLALTAVACGSCDTRVCGRIAMRMGRVGRCGPVAVPRRVRSVAVRSRPVHAPAVRRPGCGDPDTRTYGFMIYLNRTTLDLPIGTGLHRLRARPQRQRHEGQVHLPPSLLVPPLALTQPPPPLTQPPPPLAPPPSLLAPAPLAPAPLASLLALVPSPAPLAPSLALVAPLAVALATAPRR